MDNVFSGVLNQVEALKDAFKALMYLPWWLNYFTPPPYFYLSKKIFRMKDFLYTGERPRNCSHSTGVIQQQR